MTCQFLGTDVLDAQQTQSLLNSLAVFAKQLPSEQQRLELDQLIAVQSDKSQRDRIRQYAVVYPLLVLMLCGAVLAFLCVTVVPTFNKMFDEFGIAVPPLTLMVLGLSEQILRHPVRLAVLILIFILVTVGTVRLLQSWAFGTRYVGVVCSGSTHQLVTMAGICSRLADELSQQQSLPEALQSAAEQCDNSYFASALRTLANDARSGTQSLQRSSVAHNFPTNLIYALGAGPGGSVNLSLMRTLSDIYRERAAWRWDSYGGILGPIAVILVGCIVAIVVLSLFQPLIDLISGLS